MNENAINQITKSTKATTKYSDVTNIDNLVCIELNYLKEKILIDY